MATSRVTANTAAQALWTGPKHVKAKVTSVKVDNQGTALRTVRLQDLFTPDPSVGVPSPSAQTIDRLQISVGAGLTADVPETELRDLEMLGDAKAISSAIDTACVIVVMYHFE